MDLVALLLLLVDLAQASVFYSSCNNDFIEFFITNGCPSRRFVPIIKNDRNGCSTNACPFED